MNEDDSTWNDVDDYEYQRFAEEWRETR